MNARQSGANALKAVEYFEQAIRLDPNFALAYSGLAGAYIYSGIFGVGLPQVENEKAKKALEKAFELDNNLAETYAVRGDLRLKYEWNLVDAEKDLLRALELEPNNDHAHWLYALISIYRRRFDRALAEIETALTIDPGSLSYQRDRGRILYYARRYDEAIVQLKRVIELDGNFVTAYSWLWNAYEMKGDYAGAYEIFMRTQKRANPDRVEIYQKTYETAGWQGVRRKTLELAKLDENKPGSGFYQMAILSAQLGEKDQAFEYLNKAVEKHEWWIVMLNVDPPLDPLRDDPRFAELVRRVGLK